MRKKRVKSDDERGKKKKNNWASPCCKLCSNHSRLLIIVKGRVALVALNTAFRLGTDELSSGGIQLLHVAKRRTFGWIQSG